MKLQVALILAGFLAAGPAMAESRFALARDPITGAAGHPGSPSAPRPSQTFGLPQPGAAPAYKGPTSAKTYGPPATAKPEAFKPYQPYKPSSTFGPAAKKKSY